MLKKITFSALILVSSSFAVQTANLDERVASASIKNNKANILSFPFIVADAKIATSDPKAFQVKAKRDSVVVIATATVPMKADLIVWSEDGYTYLIKLDTDGLDQYWNFTSNRVQARKPKAMKFETGKIDNDIKKLFKKAILEKNIPGYKKIKVKRKFLTPDLEMQKDYIYDGSKYRVENWFLKNRTPYPINLDEANFYTKGVLAIAFEARTLPPFSIGRMHILVNKSSLENRGTKGF